LYALKQVARHRSNQAVTILVSLIIFQGVGWHLAWQSIEWKAKIAARHALIGASTPLLHVTLQQDFFQQSKIDKREIRLNGNLYDIKTSECVGDSVRLLLYHDQHEQALFALLGIHFSYLDHSTGTTPQPLALWAAQWLGLAFLMPEGILLPNAPIGVCLPVFSWCFPHTAGQHSPPFTPPQFVVVLV
jgi:hypothetical protein